MQLYFAPGACSLASHITAREAGINLDLKRADTKTKKLEDGSDYLAVNSKGAVPALKLDNGQVLTEGVAIMQYLADQKPESGLAPKNGTLERYRVQEWLNYLTSEVHKTFSPLWNPTNEQAVKDYALTNLKKKFDWLNTQLAGKKYLTGDNFTVADAYLFTLVNWTNFLAIDLAAVAGAQGVPGARRRASESAGSPGSRRPDQEGRLIDSRCRKGAAPL